jgi:putative SOS response-associated peptidase YedK
MCGRYAFFSPAESVNRLFDLKNSLPIEPRYNIAPTQYVPVVRARDGHGRELAMLYWGLVPSWAKEKSIGNRMINARAETLAEKPSFRNAFRKRRCVLLASGFYEWKRDVDRKRPFFIHRKDAQPFAMAGLWERWEKGAEPLDSCTIITTEANDFMQGLHHRMPAILGRSSLEDWLDPGLADADALQSLLRPLDGDVLVAEEVSQRVNNPRNEGPELIQGLD